MSVGKRAVLKVLPACFIVDDKQVISAFSSEIHFKGKVGNIRKVGAIILLILARKRQNYDLFFAAGAAKNRTKLVGQISHKRVFIKVSH